jgi:uncharacterized RDD family membrane protein YckC
MSDCSVPASGPVPDEPLPTPGLWRRMACFVYEGLLVFAVLMTTGLLYGGITGQRNAMLGRHGLQAVLFVVLGLYFGWFWSHGGQTVAMKAWRIRLVRADGAPVSMGRALFRYLMGWVWFVPAMLSLWLADAAGSAPIFAVLGVGVIAYSALTLLHPDRQFWHDAVCRTRLVDWHGDPPGRNRSP